MDGRLTAGFGGFRLSLLAASLLAAAGCGRGTVELRGEVTFDGRPVEGGTIAFEPADGLGPTMAAAIKDGKYAVSGPPEAAGKKVVRVQAFRVTGRKIPAGSGGEPGEMVDEVLHYIPPVYNTQSELTADVEAGSEQTIDFTLQGR